MKRQICRENLLLVHYASAKINGGNVHDGQEALSTYRNALDLAERTKDPTRRREARAAVAVAETKLKEFTYS